MFDDDNIALSFMTGLGTVKCADTRTAAYEVSDGLARLFGAVHRDRVCQRI
jgi:hypothetical protein